jgi:hypothetical protein
MDERTSVATVSTAFGEDAEDFVKDEDPAGRVHPVDAHGLTDDEVMFGSSTIEVTATPVLLGRLGVFQSHELEQERPGSSPTGSSAQSSPRRKLEFRVVRKAPSGGCGASARLHASDEGILESQSTIMRRRQRFSTGSSVSFGEVCYQSPSPSPLMPAPSPFISEPPGGGSALDVCSESPPALVDGGRPEGGRGWNLQLQLPEEDEEDADQAVADLERWQSRVEMRRSRQSLSAVRRSNSQPDDVVLSPVGSSLWQRRRKNSCTP